MSFIGNGRLSKENKDWKYLKRNNKITKNSKYKELAGIEAVSKLNAKAHVEDLRKKASRKIHTLAKITP